jgi:hypothetical protein
MSCKNAPHEIILHSGRISRHLAELMEETPTITAVETPQIKRILVFAKHDYVVNNANTILSKGGFSIHGYIVLAEAVDYVRTSAIDVVLIMGGVDPHNKISLEAALSEFAPHAKVVEHFGGPATLLHEVLTALKN